VLVVANQKSATDNLVSYAINDATGAVAVKSKLTIVNAPMMVAFARLTFIE